LVDRVQVIKWESVGAGGSQNNITPTEINPNEDGLEARSYFLQKDSGRDSLVGVSRDDNDNLTLFDNVVSVALKLLELAGAGAGVGWRKIVSGQTRVIANNFTHTTDEIVIEDGGELYQEDDGHYTLV